MDSDHPRRLRLLRFLGENRKALETSPFHVDVYTGLAPVGYDADCYPYGGERAVTDSCSQDFKFTGKERDAETGNDYFGARFYTSRFGRFLTPDPLLNSGRPTNPQTWNRYAYALNNPLSVVDPTGLYDLVNNCATDNKECNKQFQQHAKDLKEALANLQKKVDKMKDSPEKQRLEAALTALGTQGDNNGVNVTFGALSGSTAAQTDFSATQSGLLGATITYNPWPN
jgi:RHS repeat-associated protein